MNAIIYYSNTNESYNIAKYISDKICFKLIDILKLDSFDFDNIFLVFPIHYQNIPKEIKPIIKRINSNKAIVITTYGKMSHGNVLLETQKILKAKIVGAAYIPTKHTYIKDDESFRDFHKLDILIDKINNDNEITIKKYNKNKFASFFPLTRHRLNVKIIKNDKCTNCNVCNYLCKAIDNGIIKNNKCNRCLKCVINCPNKALEYKLSYSFKKYFKKKKKDDFIIF